jgi:hypothetical protein
MTDSHAVRVPLGLLRRYLRATGWRLIRTSPSGRELFALPGEVGDDDLEALLPATEAENDAPRRIDFVIDTLAQLAGVSHDFMAEKVRLIGWDVIRASLPDHVVFRDSIYLKVAENVLRHTRRLLRVAAATEVDPQPVLDAITPESVAYADSCRLGHTFRGSFGFTIESHVGASPDSILIGNEYETSPPPFERRVIQRLARGLRIIDRAGQDHDLDLLTRSFNIGFNADMCDSLVGIAESTDTESVTFNFLLSPEWPSIEDVPGPIEVRAPAIQVAKEASKALRHRAPEPNRAIVGQIIRLESKENPANLENPEGTREIVIFWESDDLGDVTVRVLLSPADYIAAIHAHEAGRSVRVEGKLVRLARSWIINKPTSFSTT